MKEQKEIKIPVLADIVKKTTKILKDALLEKGFIEANAENMILGFSENKGMSPKINAEFIISNWKKNDNLELELKKYKKAVRLSLGLPKK